MSDDDLVVDGAGALSLGGRVDVAEAVGGLGSLLGGRSLWDRALSSVQRHLALESADLVGRKPVARARASRVPQTVDPLGIEILDPWSVVRPQPGAGCDFGIIGSIAELREYLRPSFEDRVPFGSDWEATHLNTFLAQPVGLGVSVSAKTARYVPVGHALSPGANLPIKEVVQVLKDLDAVKAHSLWFNVSYDLELMFKALQWEPEYWHDVQVAVFLANSNVIELNLKTTALRLLGRKMQSLEELDEEWITLSKKAKKLRQPKLPHELPVEKVAPYGCDDACCTREIWFHPVVQEAIAQQPLIFWLEEKLMPVMREGVRHGVYLDVEELRKLQIEAKERLSVLTPRIFEAMGCPPFSLSKRAFLGEKLFEIKAIGYIETNPKSPQLGQYTCERTTQGKVATNKKILDRFRHQHPVNPLLIQFNELEAQERNYLKKLVKAAEHFATQPWAEGRSRFAFNSIGVPTGRMKCGGAGKGGEAYYKGVVDVNGQSLPDHEKAPYLPNTRSGIIAPPGYVLLAADYSQIELRIPANCAPEPVWIEAFNTGKDLHTVNAQLITNVREPGVIVQNDDKKRRGAAKSTSFALLYGGDERTIARNAGIPMEEAKQILDAYFNSLPGLRAWINGMHRSARSQKQVRTFMGRIRHLEQYFHPEPSRKDFKLWKAWKKLDQAGCREAINDPIQGGAADIFKLACIRLREYIKGTGWGLDIISPQIYWVHDEVVFYVKKEWVSRVVPVLRAAMEFPVVGWTVPIKAEFEVSSRILYAEGKVAKATKAMAKAERDGKLEELLAARAEVEQWTVVAQGPEHNNYGQLVDLETWQARYDPERPEEAAA